MSNMNCYQTGNDYSQKAKNSQPGPIPPGPIPPGPIPPKPDTKMDKVNPVRNWFIINE